MPESAACIAIRVPIRSPGVGLASKVLVLALASCLVPLAVAAQPASPSPTPVRSLVPAGPDAPTLSALPPDGSFVRVTVESGVSPFRSVAHDVTIRGSTVVVSLIQESLCLQGQRERVRFVDGFNALELIRALDAAHAFSVVQPATGATAGRARENPPSARARYEFWIGWGRKITKFFVDEETLVAHPDLLAAFTVVRDAVRTRVDPLPMRNLFHPAGRIGYLNLTSTEPATAVLDGWDKVRVPADSFDVVEGEHTVVVTGDSGRSREFTVKIVAGQISRVHVVLESP